jgi:hypothetical protein
LAAAGFFAADRAGFFGAGFAAGLSVVVAAGAARTDELVNKAKMAEAVTNSRRFKRFSGRRWISPAR